MAGECNNACEVDLGNGTEASGESWRTALTGISIDEFRAIFEYREKAVAQHDPLTGRGGPRGRVNRPNRIRKFYSDRSNCHPGPLIQRDPPIPTHAAQSPVRTAAYGTAISIADRKTVRERAISKGGRCWRSADAIWRSPSQSSLPHQIALQRNIDRSDPGFDRRSSSRRRRPTPFICPGGI